MSALLKFFGDRNKSKQGAGLAATASSQESDLPAPHLDETINLLEDFSEDVPGQELRRLWGECQANAHSDGDAGGKSLHSIASAVIEFYEGKIVKLGGGHAASMVCALARQLFRSLASVEDKQTNPVSSSSSKDSNNNHENNADLPKFAWLGRFPRPSACLEHSDAMAAQLSSREANYGYSILLLDIGNGTAASNPVWQLSYGAGGGSSLQALSSAFACDSTHWARV
eukprot:scaffold1623_cov165-Ochromonas_danica.AAC.2